MTCVTWQLIVRMIAIGVAVLFMVSTVGKATDTTIAAPASGEAARLSVEAASDLSIVDTLGGSTYAVATFGNHVLAGVGRSLIVLDFDEPTEPRETARLLLGQATLWTIEVRGPVAFVGSRAGEMFIVDVAEPSAPRLLARYSGCTGSGLVSTTDIAVAGDTVLLALRDCGFRALDISDLSQPSLIVDLSDMLAPDPYGANAVEMIDDGVAAALVGGRRLVVLDASNPATTRIIGESLPTTSSLKFQDLAFDPSTNTLVALGLRGFATFDLTDRSAPKLRSELGIDSGWRIEPYRVEIVDSVAYMATASGGVRAYALEPFGYPRHLFEYHGSARFPTDVAISGNRIYLADLNTGVEVAQLEVDASIEPLGRYRSPLSGHQHSALSVNGLVYAIHSFNPCVLSVFPAGNPMAATVLGDVRACDNWRLFVHEGYLWGIEGASALRRLLALSEPTVVLDDNPMYHYEIFDLELVGNHAFLTGSNLMAIFELTDDGGWDELRWYPFDAARGPQPRSIEIRDQLMYAVSEPSYDRADDAFFNVFDVSQPESPREVARMRTRVGPSAVALHGDRAYIVGDTDSGLHVVDISDSSRPYVRSTMPEVRLPTQQYDYDWYPHDEALLVDDDQLLVVGENLTILDVSSPGTPRFAGRYALPCTPDEMAADSEWLYIVCYDRLVVAERPRSTLASSLALPLVGNYR